MNCDNCGLDEDPIMCEECKTSLATFRLKHLWMESGEVIDNTGSKLESDLTKERCKHLCTQCAPKIYEEDTKTIPIHWRKI